MTTGARSCTVGTGSGVLADGARRFAGDLPSPAQGSHVPPHGRLGVQT